MVVDLDTWIPGVNVDDDALILDELRLFRKEVFDHEQKARVAALKSSREVLSEKSGGAFSSTTKAVDTLDLISVAGWIIDGKRLFLETRRCLETDDAIFAVLV